MILNMPYNLNASGGLKRVKHRPRLAAEILVLVPIKPAKPAGEKWLTIAAFGIGQDPLIQRA